MPAIGQGRRVVRLAPAKKKSSPRRAPPKKANVYVPPASLAPKAEREAARPKRKTPTKANVYVPPKSLASKPARRQARADETYAKILRGEPIGRAPARREDRPKQGKGAPPLTFATVTTPHGLLGAVKHAAGKYVSTVSEGDYGPVGTPMVKFAGRAVKDPYEMAVTLPTNVAHLASTAVHHPQRLPGELAAPYVELAKHPSKAFAEHPVQTLALVAPIPRTPGLVAGRVGRRFGQGKLEREPATLPGTALKTARIGSRSLGRRRRQARADRQQGAPVTTQAEVHRRVDEAFDVSRHRERTAVGEAKKQARKQAKRAGMPRPVQRLAAKQAGDVASEHAKLETEARVAQEFGANVRPHVSEAEVTTAGALRKQAKQAKDAAFATRKAADRNIKVARDAAADARGRPSDRMLMLQQDKHAALEDLAGQQEAHARTNAELQRKHANARVSAAKTKASPRLRELQGQRRAVHREHTTDDVLDARRAVRATDRHVNAIERELGRAEEASSRWQGVTEGRHKAGRMTAGAGSRAADAAERVGHLRDALHDARGMAAAARESLKRTEAEARAGVRERTRQIDRAISAEHQRIRGVAPVEHDAFMRAMTAHAEQGGQVAAARGRVRDINLDMIREARRTRGVPPAEADALFRAMSERDQARAADQAARAAHAHAKGRHVATKQQYASPQLVSAINQGRTFASKKDARKVANALNEQGHQLPAGDTLPLSFRMDEPSFQPGAPAGYQRTVHMQGGQPQVPLEFTVRQVGDDRYAVLPKAVSQRMYGGGGKGAPLSHAMVGTSKATPARMMRTSRGVFTQATLPLSLPWLGGQIAEAGQRALLTRSGPFDWARFHLVVRRMNRDRPGSGDEFAMRMLGGQFGHTGAFESQIGGLEGKTLASEFQGAASPIAKTAGALSWAGQALPLRLGRAGWRQYTKAVMGTINGFVENNTRRAMTGQAIKRDFMQHRLAGLMDGALRDAAKDLQGTHNQVHVGRELDRMYGQYSKWSPEMRSTLLHWTPYLPWYRNSIHFMLGVLPKDHPLTTALLADLNATERDWREANDLGVGSDSNVPDWLLGSYPAPGGGYYRLGHYGPSGAFQNPAQSAADVVLPQLISPIKNLAGQDWKWQSMKDPTIPRRFLRAGWTGLEEHLPGFALAGELSGVTPRVIDRKSDVPGIGERLRRKLPWTAVGGSTGGGGGGGGGVGMPDFAMPDLGGESELPDIEMP